MQATENGENINENSGKYMRFEKDTKYMLNVISFIDNFIKYEVSDYRHCILEKLKPITSVTYEILDVWNSYKSDDVVTPAPTHPPDNRGSHVIAYGLFGKFNDMSHFTAKRHVIERKLAHTLTQIVPEMVPAIPARTPINRVSLAIKLEFVTNPKPEVEAVLMPKLARQWADHIEPGIRETYRVNITGPILKAQLKIRPYAPSKVKDYTYDFMEFIFKNGTHINRDVISNYILELISNERESWKSIWLEILKPNLIFEFDQTEVKEGGNHLWSEAIIPFKIIGFYEETFNVLNKEPFNLQRFFELAFQDFIFANGDLNKVPILRDVLNISLPTPQPTTPPVSPLPSLVTYQYLYRNTPIKFVILCCIYFNCNTFLIRQHNNFLQFGFIFIYSTLHKGQFLIIISLFFI